MITEEIRADLFANQDIKYRDFQSKLVPNIPKETILGVKTPEMRKIAKEIKGTKEAEEFLAVVSEATGRRARIVPKGDGYR